MTNPEEMTVVGVDYWVDKSDQLAQLLATTDAPAIPDPSGRPVVPGHVVVLTRPAAWAQNIVELRDALAFAAGSSATQATRSSQTAAGAVAPVEDRLVYTVEEAATLLGISRSFAYEAVQRGKIPSMRIGKRILVPKAALRRFLHAENPDDSLDDE